jgi:hypothetical protein
MGDSAPKPSRRNQRRQHRTLGSMIASTASIAGSISRRPRRLDMAVDTLGYTKYLEEHGVSRAEAEAHAEALKRYLVPQCARSSLRNADNDSMTKADLKMALFDLTFWLLLSVIGIAGIWLVIARFT